MVKIYSERVAFKGTIIDLETIGKFDCMYDDSRRFKPLKPTIFGFIDRRRIQIFCAKCPDSLVKLNSKIAKKLPSLERPFHAFQADFERGVLFHSIGIKVKFERELNSEKYESMKSARLSLHIPNYDDPFDDSGRMCSEAWSRGEIDKCIAHNRSCLLKERDILLKRGFREPDKLDFVL